jgi:hypothetical protein
MPIAVPLPSRLDCFRSLLSGARLSPLVVPGSGIGDRLIASLTIVTNKLYAEFSNRGFLGLEPTCNLALAWQVGF